MNPYDHLWTFSIVVCLDVDSLLYIICVYVHDDIITVLQEHLSKNELSFEWISSDSI